MITMIRIYDGSMSLSDTRERCELDQGGGQQLKEIKSAILDLNAVNQKVEVNYAGYEERFQGLLTQLSFDPVSPSKPGGWTKLFDCSMYVEGELTPISVFGK
jgi:hypothetical protein